MPSRRLVAAIAALWTIPGLASALETSAYARTIGNPMPLWLILATRLPPWYVWALATPFVIGLVARRGIAWPPRAGTIARHVALGVAIASVHAVIYSALVRMAPLLVRAPLSFSAMLATEFLGWIPMTLIGYTALVGVGVVLVLADQAVETNRRAAQLEGALATAQLDALRAQIQPHFVFNALNTIGVFVREGDRQRALRTLTLFGDAMRTVLRSEATHVMPLADELAALRCYVEIEETRYEDRVTVEWCVDPALSGHAVPALIYQPIVENAFRHGVAHRIGPSVVQIGARADGERVTLWVRESGAALDGARDPVEPEVTNGIGLRNTAARLTALYGSAGRLTLRTAADSSLAEVDIPREHP